MVAERANVGSCRKPTFGGPSGNDGFVPELVIFTAFCAVINRRRAIIEQVLIERDEAGGRRRVEAASAPPEGGR